MKISDKELDDLFHSNLNDLEVEPNEMVWNRVADQINHNQTKRKSIVPVLRIAASVIVVISIGLLLLQKNDPIVKKPVQTKVSKTKIEQKKPVTAQTENIKPEEPMLLLSAKNKDVKEVLQNKISHKKPIAVSGSKANQELKVAEEMLAADNQTEKKDDFNTIALTAAKTSVVPDVSTRFNLKADDEKPVKPQLLPAKNSTPAVVARRKGIRSIGDVVNLVMAKVDKRQDKLIEFSDSDDGDESNVSGINLGIISIKKEK